MKTFPRMASLTPVQRGYFVFVHNTNANKEKNKYFQLNAYLEVSF